MSNQDALMQKDTAVAQRNTLLDWADQWEHVAVVGGEEGAASVAVWMRQAAAQIRRNYDLAGSDHLETLALPAGHAAEEARAG